jgi:hypothetical protein
VLVDKRNSWRRLALEGAVIVGSILAAFGIDAWWGLNQEQQRRAALLEDLEAELVSNVEGLRSALDRQRLKSDRIGILLTEIGPDPVGLPADSIRSLQNSLFLIPTWDPAFGILELLIQSGDLILFEDRELRARLASLRSETDDYVGNQGLFLELALEPEVIFGTGSVLMDFSDVAPGDTLITTASSGVREVAGKYFRWVAQLTDIVVRQGEEIEGELSATLEMLRR